MKIESFTLYYNHHVIQEHGKSQTIKILLLIILLLITNSSFCDENCVKLKAKLSSLIKMISLKIKKKMENNEGIFERLNYFF